MKALYLKGARECGIKDKPEPQPNGHDPILKVLACGICGSDVSPWKIGYNPLWAMINVPLDNGPTMGHEFVARIEDPGDAAERGFKKGDRVTMMPFDWCGNCPACRNGKEHLCMFGWATKSTGTGIDGALAEKVQGHAKWLYKIPDDITDIQACMVEPLAVAMHAVYSSQMKAGDKVLVIGAGIIGQFCGAAAKYLGASKVVLSELNVERASEAVARGAADVVINAAAEDVIQQLAMQTGGEGFDVVFECTGSGPGFDTGAMTITPGGHLMIVGSSSGQVSITPIWLQSNEPVVQGVLGYSLKAFEDAYDMIVNKKFDPTPFVTGIVPFEEEEVQKAFLRLTDPAGKDVKIVARISE